MIAAALLALALEAPALTLAREGHFTVIRAQDIPGGEIRVNYLEAYCRSGSTDADWVAHTVIAHSNRLVSASADGRELVLEDSLRDGVVVTHTLRAERGRVEITVVARNPAATASDAQWAQPCIRLGRFTGHEPPAGPDPDDYLPACFIFRGGKPAFFPFEPWARQARYTPGQVWGAPGVPRTDLNPRPLSGVVPSNGLIGCVSSDRRWLFATAWEPWQELFQGVARCLHSDFRIGGLQPGETKVIRGRWYLLPNDPDALLEQYRRDFPQTGPN